MYECKKFYVNGQWVDPIAAEEMTVINPATEEAVSVVALGGAADVDLAVKAARAAFESFSNTSREYRVELLQNIEKEFMQRYDDISLAITAEMGSPITLSKQLQAATGVIHLQTYIKVLQDYQFEQDKGPTRIRREPIGVCGLITPWNWPINQVACKVFPALAAGCTMVLKPSELTPVAATILAEVMDAAGVPDGVFNMVHGTGSVVGQAICAHPDVDMVSFTGSTRAGREVAIASAATIKRVAQELGGKSPNILVDDVDFAAAMAGALGNMMLNSGQSCAAPSRLLVPKSKLAEVNEIAKQMLQGYVVGDPSREDINLGPVANKAQFDKVQGLIEKGIEEGATVVTGGPGKPEGLETGYYVRPTVFSDVSNDMSIAREEIFGPVLCIIPYEDDADAIRIANDTDYGLSAYVTAEDKDRARRIAEQLRAGSVFINGPDLDPMAPLGGYKQSGNGREWGVGGLEEYLETKSMLGFGEASDADAENAVKLT
jgi:aldehyde dehydrogenase (NAD+)